MENQPIHVTHVVLSLAVGGLERVVAILAREGMRMGQRVSVICLERPGDLAADLEAAGVTVRCANKPLGLKPAVIGTVRRIMRELAPDVVHTHQIGALWYAGPAARLERTPVVVHTEHGKHYETRLRTRLMARTAAWHAMRFFCVSRDIAFGCVARGVVPASKVVVIANGVETARFADVGDPASVRSALDIPAGAPVIGTVGNLREVKQHDLLLRGFAKLANGNGYSAPPHLVLVGDGPRREALGRLAADLGVERRVHFAGAQSRPERFLHAMDAFALTSRYEGMPLAILEAWAAGLPVVAPRVGGIPEIVEDGTTGLLFDPGDVDALAGALSRLIADRRLAELTGRAGQLVSRSRYDASVMARAYSQHYGDFLALRPPRPRHARSGRVGDVMNECLSYPAILSAVADLVFPAFLAAA